jgi:hypothetical protein
MTIVTTMATKKLERIDVRVSEQVKEDFARVAEHHGLKTATLLHSIIVKRINDERKEHPEIFSDVPKHNMPTMTLDEAKADDKRKK